MNFPCRSILATVSVTAVFVLAQCERPPADPANKKEDKSALYNSPETTVEETGRNRMANEPTDFLRSRSEDAINWQPWTPQVLDWATAEQRPILLVIGSGQITNTYNFLDGIAAKESEVSRTFNESYLCSLADLSVNPELGLLAFRLCAETRQPFAFPLLLWLSHEGNPVAWLPVLGSDPESHTASVNNSHKVVREIWEDSPRYFVENSRRDAEGRRERMASVPGELVPDRNEARALIEKSAGSLTALYDPATRGLDLGGGLLPVNLLAFTAELALQPTLPDYLQERARRMTVNMHDVLAGAPIRDPLDRGMFVSRRSSDWSIPVFCKSARIQASAGISFASAAAVGDAPRFETVAREILAYQQESLGKGGDGIGSYQCLNSSTLETEIFFPTYAEIEELLSREQLAVAKGAFGLRERGNIPPAQDVNARFFRRNILFNARSAAEVASELGRDEGEVRSLIESSRATLLSHRAATLREKNASSRETTRIAEDNARHALALLSVGGQLGDPQLVAQGRAQVRFLRDHFYSKKNGLWRIPPGKGRRGVRARAADYSAALAAALAVYRLGLEEEDLQWAEALARETLRVLADDEHVINEIPADDAIVDLPYHHAAMTLGTSSWGVLYGSFERLRRISNDERFAAAADAIAIRIAESSQKVPLVHTDFLTGLLVQANDRVAVLHGSDAALRASLHGVLLEPAFGGTVVLDGGAPTANDRFPLHIPDSAGVTVFRDLKPLATFSDPPALREFLTQDLASE